MGKISTNSRYVIDVTGTDLLSFRELGGGVRANYENVKK